MKIELNQMNDWLVNDRYWTFCIGSGHAALALRKDYQEQLKQVCHELGFQRVRFHGIFNDDMQVVTTFHDLLKVPKSKQVKTTSFYQIKVIYDALLEMNVKPFVEIGFMPKALASKNKHVFYYKGNVSKPKQEDEWISLIKEFAHFLVEQYGMKEVETWYFEIWNEPDLKGFFFHGSKEDYFQLYKISVETIKEVIPNACVGGPATSQNRWVQEFREYCETNKIPLDFLSTHHYPGDDIGLPIFTMENIKRLLFTAKNNQGKSIHEVFNKMMVRHNILPMIKKESMYEQCVKAHKEAGNVPLYYTEWNVNPTCTNEIHDSCASAAYIIKHVLDCQYLMSGCSFFNFSDIFEENTFFSEVFSGSFGLLNIYGIPKPSYWAFYFLNQLGGYRLQLPITHENIEYAVFKNENQLQILIYAQEYVQKDTIESVNIQLPKTFVLEDTDMMSINEEDTNPKQCWIDMGSPRYLSKEQVKKIKDASKPKCVNLAYTEKEGHYEMNVSLRVNEVLFIRLYLKENGNECNSQT